MFREKNFLMTIGYHTDPQNQTPRLKRRPSTWRDMKLISASCRRELEEIFGHCRDTGKRRSCPRMANPEPTKN